MILASTDGYSNSFVSDSDFLMIGQDYLQMIRTEGIDKAEKELARFLDQTSAEGSGDDVTLGVISRIDAPGAAIPQMAAIPHAIDEEEIPMAVAAKLTADLEEARKRINQLDSTVSSLSTRVRYLQIGILVALLFAVGSFALAAYRFTPSTNRAATTFPAPARDTGKPAEAPLRLLIGQSAIVLEDGMTLTSEQLGLGANSRKIAQVRRAGGNSGSGTRQRRRSTVDRKAGGRRVQGYQERRGFRTEDRHRDPVRKRHCENRVEETSGEEIPIVV